MKRRVSREVAACVTAAGGAVALLLAAGPTLSPVATALSTHLVRPLSKAPRLAAYFGLLYATACAVVGVVGALALHRILARRGKGWVAATVAVGLVAVLGVVRARWLGYAAPLAVVALAPLFAVGSVRAGPSALRDARDAAACLACEAACLGVGVWLPFAGSAPALLLPAMTAPAAVAGYVAVVHGRGDDRWRAVVAGLPLLLLPLVGLRREPSLVPALACALVAVAAAVMLRRRPRLAARATAWARRQALTLAVPGLLLFLVLPWHFRELGMADYRGHEGQHLGWINSIAFGKLMMADAGFTYGPAREYLLALLAWLQGGLTLEHVRVAHALVNVAGFVLLFAAVRRVVAGQGYLLVLGAVLLLTHTALVSFVVYTTTYSFGWADASRAGLAVLAVVVVLSRRPDDERDSRRRLLAGGALAALATLYSHDFGFPAMLATLAGLASEVLRRGGGTRRLRARAALRSAGVYAIGLGLVLIPFLAVYAVRGRLGAFFSGYAWTYQVSNSTAPFEGKSWSVTPETFASYDALTGQSDPDTTVGAHVLDYVVGPALGMLGLAQVAAAVVRRRFVQRTALVAGLSVLATLTMHHALLASDPWHMANASTPGLVLLLALAAGARRLHVRVGAGRVLPVGAVCFAMLPLVWLANGAAIPLNARLASLASGEERPSVGKPYAYDGVPRTGDLRIGNEHLSIARYVREHSAPGDAVFCTTWLLGGGTEAFLSDRRNPTSFDKPDEVVTRALERRALEELRRDPPVLIVGHYFDQLGDDTRAYIDKGWHRSSFPDDPFILQRNR